MDPHLYLVLSCALGLAQVADACVLLKFRGKCASTVTTVFSLIEFVWAGVSYFVWRAAPEAFPHWLPAAFMAYMAAFAAAGFLLAVLHRGEGELPVPTHIAVAGGLFGAWFSVMAAIHAAA